jgi:hypothetical protein
MSTFFARPLHTRRFLTAFNSSYDAAEDNEISFREGDIITEIEAASEDWWQGKNSHGEVGLFPGRSPFFSDRVMS